MNVDDEVEVGRILAQKCIKLYSIASCWTFTIYAVCEERMVPRERSSIERMSAHQEGLFPGVPLRVFQVTMAVDVKRCHVERFNISMALRSEVDDPRTFLRSFV